MTRIEASEEGAWDQARVLITGVCGTVGRVLLRQLADAGPSEIVGIDNNETELFYLEEQYRNHRSKASVRLYLCDVRDRTGLARKMEGIDIVLHTAAFKHVILCEKSPQDAVQTNILGTQNVIEAALADNVQRVLFTSTDKAVNPTSVMGTSKLMGERLMTAANALRRGSRPIFSSTRFGNVVGSRGSVVPLFRKQIRTGGPVTLTHPEMTRFLMTVDEAVQLVLDCVFLAKGGEVFVTKMRAVRIPDLAQVMIDALAPRFGYDRDAVEISVIGKKAGEKMHEELVNEEEVRRTVELRRYYVVVPPFSGPPDSVSYTYGDSAIKNVDTSYTSANVAPMEPEALATFLAAAGQLDGPAESEVWVDRSAQSNSRAKRPVLAETTDV